MLSGPGGLACDVERLDHLGEMTGTRVPLAPVDEGGNLLGADRLCLPAARAERAPGGRVRRARHVPLEDDSLALATLRGLFDRNRREECLRVRMRRPLVDVGLRPDLHDLAEVHDGDAIGDVADE